MPIKFFYVLRCNITDKVTRKPSSKEMYMYSSKEQRQTANDFKSKTTKVKDTSSTLSTFSETSGFAIKENLQTKSELKINYVVAGVGVVYVFLIKYSYVECMGMQKGKHRLKIRQ